MEENILKVGKIIERWVTIDLSHKGMTNKMPSVSYIAQSTLSYPATLSILSSLPGDEMVRSIFVAYNLLSGDDDTTALSKTRSIYMIDMVQKMSEEYYPDVECDYCDGNGEVSCESCGGDGEIECSDCDGSGQISCEDCEGEECSLCDGDEFIKCSDCDGDGSNTCRECYGDGRFECPECQGGGETEGSEEVVNIQYSTITTQDESLAEGISERLNNEDLGSIDELLKNYIGQIMVTNVIDDIVDFYDEWYGEDIEYRLENIKRNSKGYKIDRNNKISAF
jgi:hypothetical protein